MPDETATKHQITQEVESIRQGFSFHQKPSSPEYSFRECSDFNTSGFLLLIH